MRWAAITMQLTTGDRTLSCVDQLPAGARPLTRELKRVARALLAGVRPAMGQ